MRYMDSSLFMMGVQDTLHQISLRFDEDVKKEKEPSLKSESKSEKRLCTNCDVVLKDKEQFEDSDGNEYCEKCKDDFEAIAEDFSEDKE